MYLSIIIPCFNEEEKIKENLIKIKKFLNNKYLNDYEIIIVNDGSSDDTKNIIKNLLQEFKELKLINFIKNEGRGKALREGITQAKGKFIIAIDSDLSYDLSHVEKILRSLIKSKADISLASIYCKNGKAIGVPFFKLFKSYLINKFLKITSQYDFSTFTCMVRGYNAKNIKKLNLIEDGKEIHLEILLKAKLNNLKIVEIPAKLNWKGIKHRTFRDTNDTHKKKDQILNHLLYSFYFNPFIYFKATLYPLIIISLISIVLLIKTILFNFQKLDLISSVSLTFSNSKVIVSTLILSIILIALIIIFLFFTAQNKKIYEEIIKKNN